MLITMSGMTSMAPCGLSLRSAMAVARSTRRSFGQEGDDDDDEEEEEEEEEEEQEGAMYHSPFHNTLAAAAAARPGTSLGAAGCATHEGQLVVRSVSRPDVFESCWGHHPHWHDGHGTPAVQAHQAQH